MGIGERVRKAEEDKAEAQLNAEGKLSGRQFKEIVSLGLSLGDAKELAASGIPFEDIKEIAEAQAQTLRHTASVSPAADLGAVIAQNREFMEKVIEKARSRRPESYNGDFPFPNISAFNPDGDAKPAPRLKCEMWEGFWDPKARKAMKGHPLEQGDDGLGPLTKREARLLNQLRAGVYLITNNDDERAEVRVEVEEAPGGQPTLLIIAYPLNWVDNENRKKKPSITKVCCEVFDLNPRKPAEIDAWLDEKERETVAA